MGQAHSVRLEICEFDGADRWRWRLTDAEGAFLADHAVALDRNDPRYEALFNLPAYLWQHSAPDRRDPDERRLLSEVGAWIGETVLGRAIGEKIVAHGFPPITVRVVVPQAAEQLLVMPLEIAHARGKPLARQDVSLVFESPGAAPPASAPIGDRLRMLAVFSLPPAGSPLNLRRERQMLRALVHSLAGSGSAIELRVLQYGVTRDSLRDVLQDGGGWDLLHFSGHGLPGSLVLEKPDGRRDPISGSEVADLLRQSGRRLKLVVLSSCLSAAASIAQTLSWLNIETARTEAAAGEPAGATDQAPDAAPTVARALVGALDCAVVAMRYAIEDEFAMAYGGHVYDGLFRQRQSLPQATQIALGRALDGGGAGALSAATPALFGGKAAELRLTPPQRPASGFAVPETGLAFFPPEREHFVGRVAAMTRASAALAAESGKSGVLFHGMAGAGKTSCVLELAYQHEAAGRFQAFVWFKAPEGNDIQSALLYLAFAMETQLPGFAMVHVVDSVAALKAWLPRLTALLANNAVLVVLDNLESLLTGSGNWRDERWAMLIEALVAPGGLSRTVLTSRIPLARLPPAVEIVPVHALPLAEALLLMRDLPNLRRLLDGKAPGVARDAGRLLVRRALRLVQGHPTLIDFAEKLAVDPQSLAARLDRAEAAEGAELDAFFRAGESEFDPAAFTASLRDWTTGIVAGLPEAARTLFHCLCAMEESDRERWILQGNWAALSKRLGRPEPASPFAEALAPLRRRSGRGEADGRGGRGVRGADPSRRRRGRTRRGRSGFPGSSRRRTGGDLADGDAVGVGTSREGARGGSADCSRRVGRIPLSQSAARLGNGVVHAGADGSAR